MKSVLGLSIAVLLAAGSVAWADALTGDAAKGADAFASACARCHRSPDRVATDANLDQPETVYALDDFLATHHTSDAVMRANIIAYLLAN